MSIIKEKRMWMRNTNCMSDYSEVRHGFSILQEFFAHGNPDRTKLETALESCSPGVAVEAIKLFDGWLQDTTLNTHITSVSEHDSSEDLHGRLSMWRAFGGNSARVAFVFKVPYMTGVAEELKVMFSPVAYLSKNGVHDVLREVIRNINKEVCFLQSMDRSLLVAMIFSMLIAAVTCLKHEGFHEEKEWRVIYSPKRSPSPFMRPVIKEVFGVPQLVYLLPLDGSLSNNLTDIDLVNMLDRIIIGPSSYPWPMYEAFTAALTEAGFKDAAERVFVSGIPIRS